MEADIISPVDESCTQTVKDKLFGRLKLECSKVCLKRLHAMWIHHIIREFLLV